MKTLHVQCMYSTYYESKYLVGKVICPLQRDLRVEGLSVQFSLTTVTNAQIDSFPISLYVVYNQSLEIQKDNNMVVMLDDKTKGSVIQHGCHTITFWISRDWLQTTYSDQIMNSLIKPNICSTPSPLRCIYITGPHQLYKLPYHNLLYQRKYVNVAYLFQHTSQIFDAICQEYVLQCT